MNNREIKIFVVDDHPIVADGIKALLQNEKDLLVIGNATDASTALDSINKLKPDIAIVDISLKSGMNGIELTKSLKSLYSNLFIIILSMYDEAVYAERALKAGARGYIMKNEMSSAIVKAIRSVLCGNIYVSDRLTSTLLNSFVFGSPKKDGDIISCLSDREFEIFELIGNGYKTQDVAKSLNLSVKTVETYKQRIKEKLNITSSPELTKFAIEWVNKK